MSGHARSRPTRSLDTAWEITWQLEGAGPAEVSLEPPVLTLSAAVVAHVGALVAASALGGEE